MSQPEVEMIRAAYAAGGDSAAVKQLRRLFPGIPPNAEAVACIVSIVGWSLVPVVPIGRLYP